MDLTTMLRKLRRSVASFAVVAIIASLSVASAVSAFSDVKESDWYFSNVQTLVDAGVLDGTKDMFHPADNLNRAEAAKIAVLAAGVAEEDLVNPETPSFSDVPKSLWAYKYIETAKSLGYVSGDAGKKTFRPGDNVNRAEYAKMMSLALELEENLVGGPHFSDVASSAWYYNVVETAYNWSVVSGYEGGIFKPSAAINRAEMSKMTVAAMDPTARGEVVVPPVSTVDCVKTPTDPSCVVAPPVAGADISVSLASDTPVATTHASGTAYNNALKFNVTAAANADAKVTGVTLTRGGISVDSNLSGVAVFDATGKRHGNFLTFSENKAAISFASEPIIVAKGTTQAISIKTNVSGTSGTYQISVGSAADITTDGGKVTGSFPVTGSTFQLANGGAIVGALTVDAVLVHNNAALDATVVNVDLGTKDQDIARFRLAAGANEDIKVNKIALYNNGNTNDGDVKNIRLVGPDGTVLSTVAQTKDRMLTFDLSAAPYVITKGNSRDLTVRLDVVSGSTRTVRFVIQNDYDVEITGASTLSGILATAATTVDGAFPIGDSSGGGASCTGVVVCINKITVNSGTILFAKSNDSPTGNIAAGGTNVTIGKWDVTAQGEDMELRTVSAVLTYGTVPTGSFKIKVGDATVYSSSTFTTSPMTQAVTLSSYPVIKAGVKTTISYVIDVGSSTPSGTAYAVSMNITQVKRLSTNDLVAPGTNVTSANTLTVATASLSTSKNSSFNDTTVVAGLTNGKIGSFNLNASTTEDVTVSSLTVALGGTQGITNLSNLKIMNGATQLGQSITTPAASNVFSISGFKILKGTTVTVDVFVTSNSSVTNANTSIPSLTAVGASGASSSVTITATGLTVVGQTITWATAGTLSVALDNTNTPVASILHSGMIDSNLLAIRLTASNAEDVKVTSLQVSGPNGTSSIKDLKLFIGNVQQGTTTQLVNGVASFADFTNGLLVIPKDTTVTLLVKGSTNSSGTLNSQAVANLYLDYVEALGVSGGAKIKPGTTTSTTWTAVSTTAVSAAPAALTVSDTTGFHAGDVVFAFAGSGGGALGMVTAEPTGTTALRVATVGGALTYNATGALISKLESGATTAASAGAPTIAGVSITVTSSRAFSIGDAVIVYGADNATTPTAHDLLLGYVSAIADSTHLTIKTTATLGQTAARVSKIGTGNVTTVATAGVTQTQAPVSQTVTSTSGFSNGDIVFAFDSTNGGSLGMVTSVDSSTAMTVGTNTAVTAASATSMTFIRVGSANPSTSLVSSAVTTGGNRVIAATAASSATAGVTDDTGFGIGDPVMTIAATGGAILGKVSVLRTSIAAMLVNSAAASGTAITRITRLPSAASAGAALTFEDVEPTVTVNSLVAGGSSTGQSSQPVAMLDVKADGDRNMNLTSFQIQANGNNNPTVFVTTYDLYNGSNLLSSAAPLSLATSDSNNHAVSGADIKLCGNVDTTLAGDVGMVAPVSAANFAKLKLGDTITLYKDNSNFITATISTTPVQGSACTGGTGGTASDVSFSVTGSTTTGTVTSNVVTAVKTNSVFFDSAASPALATQTITAGSTMTLTVKANTASVRSGLGAGVTASFNIKVPGTQGSTGGVTWGYTPSVGSAVSGLTISDSYPVNGPTFIY